EGYRDAAVAAAIQHVDRDVAAVAAQHDVEPAVADLELANHHLVDEVRQTRLAKAHPFAGRIEAQSEAGLQERERRRARPGLGRAGDRIEGRPLARHAPEA